MTTDKRTPHPHQLSRRDFIAVAGAAALAPAQAQAAEGPKTKNGVVVRLDAGPVDRLNEMVSFPANPKQWFDNWRDVWGKFMVDNRKSVQSCVGNTTHPTCAI